MKPQLDFNVAPDPDKGTKFDELVAARPFPNDAQASYDACLSEKEPKIIDITNMTQEAFFAEVLLAAGTHTCIEAITDIKPEDDPDFPPACKISSKVARLFGLSWFGRSNFETGATYYIRLYNYKEAGDKGYELESQALVYAHFVRRGASEEILKLFAPDREPEDDEAKTLN